MGTVRFDKKSDIKVLVVPREDLAVSDYRLLTPLTYMNMNSTEVSVIVADPYHHERLKNIYKADVLYTARGLGQGFTDMIVDARKENNLKVVIDYDDNLFNVSPFSPHYAQHGVQECKYRFPDGSEVDLWKDGENGFNVFQNEIFMDSIKDACTYIADYITVTTPILGKIMAAYNKNIEVLPNCIDITKWNNISYDNKPKDDMLRICWYGGFSHYKDWHVIKDVLPEIYNNYKDRIRFVIGGHLFRESMKGIPDDKIEFYDWCHFKEHPYQTALMKPDIGIIPLNIDEFSVCKSEIKLVELGSLSCPCVVSNTYPYLFFGDRNAVFVDNTHDAWYEGIKQMIEDSILRNHIGALARRRVEESYSIQTQWTRWLDFIKRVVE